MHLVAAVAATAPAYAGTAVSATPPPPPTTTTTTTTTMPQLKRFRVDSSSSPASPTSTAASTAAVYRMVTPSATARRQTERESPTKRVVDDTLSAATECRAPTALSMKDLLNGTESPRKQDVECGTGTGAVETRSAGEWLTRITVENVEIEAASEQCVSLPVGRACAEAITAGADHVLDRKCQRLAELIRGSKHLVAFTGAGISTSVGLPDYRGDNGIRTKGFEKQQKRRKVTTGRAALAAHDTLLLASSSSSDSESAKQCAIPDFNQLVPSVTHMALFELHRLGYLKHVVSQNVDNLHLKSGLPASVLTEVHGNATQAKCETCEKIYTRDFPWTGLCDDSACVSTKRSVEQRLRARTRHGNGRLKRNVISFDEPLGDIDNAIDECEAADVALVLGTSLRVEPFSEMAGEYAESLAIVNLQPTTQKLDARAESSGVRLFEKCDVVMAKTMKWLLGADYEIPAWSGEHPTSVFMPEHEAKSLVNVLAGRLLS